MEPVTAEDVDVLPGIRLTYGKTGLHTQLTASPHASLDLAFEAEKLRNQLNGNFPQAGAIKSAPIHQLNSPNLAEFKELLLKADQRYSRFDALLKTDQQKHEKTCGQVFRYQRHLFGFLFRKRLARLQERMLELEASVADLQQKVANSQVALEVDSDDEFYQLYELLVRGFNILQQSAKKWDFTSSVKTNRLVERTTASNTVTRTAIDLQERQLPILHFKNFACCFRNANGGDLYFFPGFIIVYESPAHFALIDFADLDVSHQHTRFIESEPVPADAKVVDQTWYKANKDGSPDRRFNGNYQIPIVRYSELTIKTAKGLNERYCFSNAEYGELFFKALHQYVDALKKAKAQLKAF